LINCGPLIPNLQIQKKLQTSPAVNITPRPDSNSSFTITPASSRRVEAEEYRLLPRQDLLARRANKIIAKYISDGAQTPLPLRESIRGEVVYTARAGIPGPGLFLPTQIEVRLMLMMWRGKSANDSCRTTSNVRKAPF
jgi:hypothetical protein